MSYHSLSVAFASRPPNLCKSAPKTPVASEDYPMIVTIDDTVEVRERHWTEYLADLWLGKGDRVRLSVRGRCRYTHSHSDPDARYCSQNGNYTNLNKREKFRRKCDRMNVKRIQTSQHEITCQPAQKSRVEKRGLNSWTYKHSHVNSTWGMSRVTSVSTSANCQLANGVHFASSSTQAKNNEKPLDCREKDMPGPDLNYCLLFNDAFNISDYTTSNSWR